MFFRFDIPKRKLLSGHCSPEVLEDNEFRLGICYDGPPRNYEILPPRPGYRDCDSFHIHLLWFHITLKWVAKRKYIKQQ